MLAKEILDWLRQYSTFYPICVAANNGLDDEEYAQFLVDIALMQKPEADKDYAVEFSRSLAIGIEIGLAVAARKSN